jgi:hypothetical protein
MLQMALWAPMQTESEYCARLKAQTKALYGAVISVFCPYFNEAVIFSSEGFHHLQYDSSGSERTKKAQIRRYKAFPLAPFVLSQAGTVQQYRTDIRAMKHIRDWCFVALVTSTPGHFIELKIIVRKIGSGRLKFCSVMPFKAPNYLGSADPD